MLSLAIAAVVMAFVAFQVGRVVELRRGGRMRDAERLVWSRIVCDYCKATCEGTAAVWRQHYNRRDRMVSNN